MLKYLEKTKDAEGRTVAQAILHNDDKLIITFTDGTYLAWEGDRPDDWTPLHEISINPLRFIMSQCVRWGLLSEEEYLLLKKEVQKQKAEACVRVEEKKAQNEYQEYKRLKKKFERT